MLAPTPFARRVVAVTFVPMKLPLILFFVPDTTIPLPPKRWMFRPRMSLL
jgi:hypothetical protein